MDSHGAHLSHHSKKTTGGHESHDHCIGGHNITQQSWIRRFPVLSEMLHPETQWPSTANKASPSLGLDGTAVWGPQPHVDCRSPQGLTSPGVTSPLLMPTPSAVCGSLPGDLWPFARSPCFPCSPRHLAFHETALAFSDAQ